MKYPIIDAHIHVDLYKEAEQNRIFNDRKDNGVAALISVSNHLSSSKTNLQLSKENVFIKPAFGFHPEQELPTENEMIRLLDFIEDHQNEMVAIGEVGLPYYLRTENPKIPLEAYVEILKEFVGKAKTLNKPIVLHAIYEDAPIVCKLLEEYSIANAHFHWFKGDQKMVTRMAQNGYYISITPDVFYEKEIQDLVWQYPLSQMMVETDGPWPFEDQFANQITHPKMIHQTIREIARIKKRDLVDVYDILYKNTKRFYRICEM